MAFVFHAHIIIHHMATETKCITHITLHAISRSIQLSIVPLRTARTWELWLLFTVMHINSLVDKLRLTTHIAAVIYRLAREEQKIIHTIFDIAALFAASLFGTHELEPWRKDCVCSYTWPHNPIAKFIWRTTKICRHEAMGDPSYFPKLQANFGKLR